jgi:uncharacterized integral membrane protein (TIGR00697 family)
MKEHKFTIISVVFITLLIISNLMATKLTSILGMILPSAVIIYPLCFMVGDILTEVWGFKKAKMVILLGFAANFFLVICTNIGIYLPYPEFFTDQAAFATIFGAVPRIVVGSFAGYLAGELSNSWAMERIKKITGTKLMFVRTIGSSVVGQVLDTLIFFSIAFYGTMPNRDLIIMMTTQYVFKVLCEAIGGTPLAYGLIKWAKKGQYEN